MRNKPILLGATPRLCRFTARGRPPLIANRGADIPLCRPPLIISSSSAATNYASDPYTTLFVSAFKSTIVEQQSWVAKAETVGIILSFPSHLAFATALDELPFQCPKLLLTPASTGGKAKPLKV